MEIHFINLMHSELRFIFNSHQSKGYVLHNNASLCTLCSDVVASCFSVKVTPGQRRVAIVKSRGTGPVSENRGKTVGQRPATRTVSNSRGKRDKNAQERGHDLSGDNARSLDSFTRRDRQKNR
ncbi:hypothetical protein ElyMa_001925200 [Elysia marginata]|uniref:Uncharacterized protein n=1 Tax=Elysia marginata TaxID=1093978 RepID=A0AAV4EUX5_9GAST|nr:hypothetical protein ElyMa_001925200 [Elysia marginata]